MGLKRSYGFLCLVESLFRWRFSLGVGGFLYSFLNGGINVSAHVTIELGKPWVNGG